MLTMFILEDAPMLTFFHGWRRKMGVATLAMACVLAALWVRSQTMCDWIEFEVTDPPKFGETRSFKWMSTQGAAIELISEPFLPFGRIRKMGQWRTAPVDKATSLPELEWRLSIFGCGFGEIISSETQFGGSFWSIRYFPVALSLTLLSAYLLLSKPRPKPEQQVTRA